MNKNRIRPTAANLELQSLIRRCDIEFDQRARYVEFVCDMWNEGRFGIGRPYPVTVKWHDRPEPEPASFVDLDACGQHGLIGPNGSPPLFTHFSRVRAGDPKIEAAFQKAKQMGFLTTTPPGTHLISCSSSNQGRGSP